MGRQLTKSIRNCCECPAFRQQGAEEARCVMNGKPFGTHPVKKSAPGWCPLRNLAVRLEYKGR